MSLHSLLKEDPVRADRYQTHLVERLVFVPFAVLAELTYGAATRNWGTQRMRRMEQLIASCEVVHTNLTLCNLWAHVRHSGKLTGNPIEQQDAWVAATALYLEAPLLTHNARHFQSVPLLQVVTEPDLSP